jgi:hypothetical protein
MHKPTVVTIFAHYNAENIIDNACLQNLAGLKAISNQIIFISTSNLPEIEITKIENYCDAIQCRENIGLDFGSYQLGLQLIDKEKIDYLILANDSVYGPIYPLKETFDKAIKSPADVFGITLSNEKHPHLQSYFLIFKKQVMNSAAFNDFWQNLDLGKDKKEIIHDYEIGLSKTLLKANFKLDAIYKCNLNTFQKIFIFVINTQLGYKLYILKKLIYKLQKKKDLGFNPMHLLPYTLVKKYRVPFIKKELLNKNPHQIKLNTKTLQTLPSSTNKRLNNLP